MHILIVGFITIFLYYTGEVISKTLTAYQGAITRDAIARNIYTRVFEWARHLVNASLAPVAESGSSEGGAGSLASCVGILDIFGFENLGFNSFEQLCINYSCEVLHKVSIGCIV